MSVQLPTAPVDGPASARLRAVQTPEGTPLQFHVARAGDRAAAFVFDAFIIGFFLLLVGIGLGMTAAVGALSGAGGGEALLALMLLISFVTRTFYFTWFELRWQGATPGKRRLGLRVVDWRGGPFTAEAVFARNLTREIEVFGPLSLSLTPEAVGLDLPWYLRLVALAWAIVLTLMPLFNRDRRRFGDLVAGTMVVETPDAVLLPDLSQTPRTRVPRSRRPGAEFAFTDEQLSVYGVYELQVLEEVLRREGPGTLEAQHKVGRSIRKKIGYRENVPRRESGAFLQAFYTAQREHLERRMLLGERRERKAE